MRLEHCRSGFLATDNRFGRACTPACTSGETEELAGSRLATSAQPTRTTSPFSLHVSSQHAPQPIVIDGALENTGALLEASVANGFPPLSHRGV